MSKYTKCPECGLKMRGGDIMRHKKAFHHKTQKETLKRLEKEKP